jgi:hypothetical protein
VAAHRTNLLEERLSTVDVAANGAVRLSLRPFEIVTLEVALAPRAV